MIDVTHILSVIEQVDAQASYVGAYVWYATGIWAGEEYAAAMRDL